ncbi:hypothetical protein F1B92_04025 [Campylobacter sp. FMV-PI01]|uniref:Highly acidic protein n=1 Tax=Campylobacter portucalensis TaxID=2608384 RepID=A0A6L5WGQ5_9BACT|nr:hypothetical protein [Campylobacter portucalensis]MSN96360.1 hypothetical protein [Campylobacter portucalensis]
MKVFLDSQDKLGISTLVEISCDRGGFDLVEDGAYDILIKDVEKDEELLNFDENKTIFLLPKNLSDAYSFKNQIIKPFLPTELIQILKDIGKKNIVEKKTAQDISEINATLKEIEEIDNEFDASNNLYDQDNFFDYENLEINDDIPLDEIALNLQSQNDKSSCENILNEDNENLEINILDESLNDKKDVSLKPLSSEEETYKNQDCNTKDILKNEIEKGVENLLLNGDLKDILKDMKIVVSVTFEDKN